MKMYTFEQMREQVSFLRHELQRAIAADKAEAASFWTDVKRTGKHGLLFASGEEDRFEAEAGTMVTNAMAAMADIETKCDGPLRTNAPVPQQLKSDEDDWRARALRVETMIGRCVKQSSVPGWSGNAEPGYVKAVEVQRKALLELKGVMLSTGQSCLVGAMLNQAIFEAVGNAAYRARAKVEGDRSAGWTWYYRRTANALPILEALGEQVDRAVGGEVADGSANILSIEAESTVSALPNLLVEGNWPTGGDAADAVPADTGKGVASDGSGADTNLEAMIRSWVAGVRL